MATRQPPINIEAEKTVLGGMMQSKRVCYDALSMLDESDFYNESNRYVFIAMKNLERHNTKIDFTALTTELKNNMKVLDKIGNFDYLQELQSYYIGESNATYHINTVHNLALLRKLFTTSKDLEDQYYSKSITDTADYIEMYDNAISTITKHRASGEFRATTDIVNNLTKELETRRLNPISDNVVGIHSGYPSLDNLTYGWQPGQLIILAARPSVGKTAFALNLAINAAKIDKKTVAVFSLEMSGEEVCKRLLASVSNVNSRCLTNGKITEQDWMAIEEGKEEFNRYKILVDDTSGIRLGDIKTKVTKLKARDPNLGLVVIDYLGLITLANPKADNRQNVDEISRSLKGLARDLGVPVLCLCQLSRANEKAARKPMLSDLRDSGSIEQDADIVMFIHRENYQKDGTTEQISQDETENPSPFNAVETTEILLRKNRAGQIGTVKLAFMMSISKFVEFTGGASEVDD